MKKLKGCSKAVKMKYLIFIFTTAMFVALPTRVYQLLALVNQERGFFEETDITVPVLYGITALFVLSFLALSYISKEVPSPKLPTGKNPILGVASIVTAAGFLWDILAVIKSIVPAYSDRAESFGAMLQINFEQSGGILSALQIVFAIFAIFYMLIFAISHLNGVASYKEYKMLALAPVCWAIIKLISKLMNAVSFITVSELLFEIFMFVFATLFLLTFARISSGVFTEDSMWGIFGYGFATAFFAGLVTIPRIVCIVVSFDAVEGHPFNFSDLSILIFTLSYIMASLGIGFKDGFKNRRAADTIKLPDDVVVKKEKAVKTEEVDVLKELGMADEEEEEFVYEEAFPQAAAEEKSFFEEVVEASKPVEEVTEEVIEEEIIEEAAEEPTEDKISEEIAEEIAEEVTEEIVEDDDFEAMDIFAEETEDEDVDEVTEEVIEDEIIEEATEEAVEDEIAEEIVDEVAEDDDFEAINVFAEETEDEVVEEIIEEVIEDEIVEEIAEEVIEDNIAEEVVVDESFDAVDIIEEKVEKKPKTEPKQKKGLFGKKKKQEAVEEVAEDLKPISLADLKKNNEQ